MGCVCALQWLESWSKPSTAFWPPVIYSLLSWLSLEVFLLHLGQPETFPSHNWLLILILPFHIILQKLSLVIGSHSYISKKNTLIFKIASNFSLLLEKLSPVTEVFLWCVPALNTVRVGVYVPSFGVPLLLIGKLAILNERQLLE